MTPSEEIVTRYSRVEREADTLGRIIVIQNQNGERGRT